MSTSRPADGTFAASLNLSHPFVASLDRLWVCDATGAIPDLIAGSASLVDDQGTPGETTTGAIGRTVDGDGSTMKALLAGVTPNITTVPFVLAAIFQYTGAAPGANEALFSMGCDTAVGDNGFAYIGIDTAGHIVGASRRITGGTPGYMSGGAFSSGNQQAVVAVFYESDGVKCAMFVDGVKVNDTTDGADVWDNSETFLCPAINGLHRSGGAAAVIASSKSRVAAVGYSRVQLADQVYLDWTADPWSIAAPSGPALVDYIPGSVMSRGGWTDQDDSTDDADIIAAFEAVRNDATYVKSPPNPTVDNYLEVGLLAAIGGGPVEVPAVATDHTFIYTMCADGVLNARVELRAGDGYVVDERTFTPIAQNGVAGTPEFYVTGTLTLDAGQVALLVEHGYDGAKFRFTPGITV